MRVHVGRIPVEITRAEAARFERPLLLLHGLWSGSWIWGRLAAHLAHRGWESWAPSMLEQAPPPDHASILRELEEVVGALPVAPIVITHDTGVVGAARCAATAGLPAMIAIAPVLAPADAAGERGIFAWPQFWRARLWGSRVWPPRGSAALAFLGPARRLQGLLAPDSGPRFRALAAAHVRLPAGVGCPGLVVSADRDPVSSAASGARLAARFGWERRLYPGRGHFPMLAPGWEELAGDLHRWIVQTLGAPVLTLLDDEEPPDDGEA